MSDLRQDDDVPIRLPAGFVVGNHVVDGWLRDGGMSALYRGHHTEPPHGRAAIKVQVWGTEDREISSARFDREGDILERLSGAPAIVNLVEGGTLADGRRYLVMDWLEGANLEELIDAVRNEDELLSIARVCRVLKEVALALHAVHCTNVVHRDVKPSNIMITRADAAHETATLLDFGVSADLGTGGLSPDLTATGIILGTSGYAAPEQSILPAAPALDIYSLGVVVFEATTGYRPPPESLGPTRLPPLGELRPRVPAALERLVESCLSRDPTQRPQSGAVVARRLGAILDGLSDRESTTPTETVDSGRSDRESTTPTSIVDGGRPDHAAETLQASTALPVEPSTKSRGWVALMLLVLGTFALWYYLHSLQPHSFGVGAKVRPDVGTSVRSAARDPIQAMSVPTAEPHPQVKRRPQIEPVVAIADPIAQPERPVSPPRESGVTGSAPPVSSLQDDTGGPPTAVAPSCGQLRDFAQVALRDRRWRSALRHSTRASCWKGADRRLERSYLRLKALLELGRYSRCVHEGAGEIDSRIVELIRFCRDRQGETQ